MTAEDVILDDVVEEGRLVSLAEVKDLLEKAQKDREELTYEQKIALEHAIRFARVDPKAAKGIIQDITKEFPDLDPKFAFKLADLVPQHPDDVRSILQKATVDLSEDDCAKVVEIIDKYYVA